VSRKRDQLDEQLKALEARKKETERKADTRRKVIAGALALRQEEAERQREAEQERERDVPARDERCSLPPAPAPNCARSPSAIASCGIVTETG
jgi:hypothetical protein